MEAESSRSIKVVARILAAGLLLLGATIATFANASARVSSAAATSPSTDLDATFSPERLGAPTSISFRVRIGSPPDLQLVPALSGVEVSYPTNLGLATSGLGVQSCDPAVLRSEGSGTCPADSKMGQGSALVEVPFGPAIVRERVALELYAAPSNDGYIHLAVVAIGKEPVLAQILMTGVLLPGRLQMEVPPIVSQPGASYVSVVEVQAVLGGALTYYERGAHGHTVAYRPRGIGLPATCPRGGFKLATKLAFSDGLHSQAATSVPCPRRR